MTQQARESLGDKIVRHWLGIVFGVALTAFCLALLHAAAEVHLDWREHTVSVPYAEAGDPQKAQPVVQAWVDTTPLQVDRPVALHLRFQNPTARRWSVRFGELYKPHLEGGSEGRVWLSGAWGGHKRSWRKAQLVLPPDGEAMVTAELHPGKEAGNVTLIPTVLLSAPAEGQTPETRFKWALPIWNLRILTPEKTYWAQVLKSFITLLGILALPTAGGLLAFGFQQRQQRLAQEKEVWAQMLPVSHKNNVEYYTPLGSAIRSLRSTLIRQKGREGWPVLLFYLLLVHHRYRVVLNKLGGFHLQSRQGERLVGELYARYIFSRRDELSEEEDRYLGQLVNQVGDTTSFSGFLDKLDASRRETFEGLSERIGAWLTSPEGRRAVHWMFMAHHVLMYEINGIYEFWYGDPAKSPRREVEELVEFLRGTRKLEDLSDVVRGEEALLRDASSYAVATEVVGLAREEEEAGG
jgi:hypothetical protein